MKSLTLTGFLLRLLFALSLVMLTYNPSGYSYLHWVNNSLQNISPQLVVAGVTLVIGWVILLRATLRSLGAIGLILAVLFFSSIIWLLIDQGWLSLQNMNQLNWAILVVISLVLAIGVSWSHIRRKLTGQVDSDDVDEE